MAMFLPSFARRSYIGLSPAETRVLTCAEMEGVKIKGKAQDIKQIRAAITKATGGKP